MEKDGSECVILMKENLLKMNRLPSVRSGVSWRFIMSGIDGPKTSASSKPTSFSGSNCFMATARLAAIYIFITTVLYVGIEDLKG